MKPFYLVLGFLFLFLGARPNAVHCRPFPPPAGEKVAGFGHPKAAEVEARKSNKGMGGSLKSMAFILASVADNFYGIGFFEVLGQKDSVSGLLTLHRILTLRRGGVRSGLHGLEHALTDLLGIKLEDLDAVVVGRGRRAGDVKRLLLNPLGDLGGLFRGNGAVTLGQDGRRGERLDEAVDNGVASLLRRRPDAEGDLHWLLRSFRSGSLLS
nr:hypothetical protein DVH24_020653 [Ipomoea batatas]GME19941.1 hypothetical protein DVH24_020653 [Ipomoea batatas]